MSAGGRLHGYRTVPVPREAGSTAGSSRPGLCERPAALRELAQGRGAPPEGVRSSRALAPGGLGGSRRSGVERCSRGHLRSSRGQPTTAPGWGRRLKRGQRGCLFSASPVELVTAACDTPLRAGGPLSHTGDGEGNGDRLARAPDERPQGLRWTTVRQGHQGPRDSLLDNLAEGLGLEKILRS